MSAPPAAAQTTKLQAAYDMFKQLVLIPIDRTALKITPELGHLAPILFTVGSFIFGLLTLNPALGLFGFAGAEAYLIRNAYELMSSYIAIAPTAFKPSNSDPVCESSIHTYTPQRFQHLFASGIMDLFPNTPLYYLTFGAVYLIQSMLYFRQEMEALGPQYSNRPYIAILSAALIIALFAVFLLNYKCTGLITVFSTVLLGGFVGVLLAYQNYFLFGKKGVNVLFIAPLERRTGMDYLCVTTNKAS